MNETPNYDSVNLVIRPLELVLEAGLAFIRIEMF